MNRARRFVRHLSMVVAALALVTALLAVLPGQSWAQQLVRATITNATIAVTQSGTWNIGTVSGSVTVTDGAGSLNVIVDSGSLTADTELPAAAALADNTANPTVPGLAAYLMVFDGTTWDRAQAVVDATQGGTVQATGPQIMFEAINFDGTASPTTVTEGQAIRPKATTSGISEVLLTSADGSVSPQATIGSTPLVRVGIFDNANNQIIAFGGSGGTASNFGAAFPTPGTAAGFSDGTNMQGARVYDADTDAGTFYSLFSTLCVGTTSGCVEGGTTSNPIIVQDNGALLTSSQLIDDTIFADEAAFTYATSKVQAMGAVAESTTDTLADGALGAPVMTLSRFLRTTPTAYSTGGGTTTRYISVGTTEDEHAVCTGACTLYSVIVTNTNAAARFLKCENDTAANTAPGTDTPEFSIAIPGASAGAGAGFSVPVGAAFPTALTCWLVTGAADSDVAEVAANEIMVNYVTGQ